MAGLATILVLSTVAIAARQASPRIAVEELLTADVSFAAAGTTRDLPSALGAMFAADVVMPMPGLGFANSRDEAIAALHRDSLNKSSRVIWSPVRGGISADGPHGFTFGYITTVRADGTRLPGCISHTG